jgi:hypothetical protein
VQNTVTDSNAEYIVQQLREGNGVEITSDPDTGRTTGIVGVESGSEFSRWVADRAERRASTRNV